MSVETAGLKETVEQTLNARQEFGYSRAAWEQERELEDRLVDYLVEKAGLDEQKAERQAGEIVTDTVIGDMEEAKQKIDVIETLCDEFRSEGIQDVAQRALEFYQAANRHDRGTPVYTEAKEELEQTAERYLSSAFDMEAAAVQASRISTEVALGNGHIYDVMAKLRAIEAFEQLRNGPYLEGVN